MLQKPHYFELVMRSVSEDTLNQEVVIVREYAKTPGELTVKQMQFTREAAAPIAAIVVDTMDKMSMPIQEMGLQELQADLSAFGEGLSKPDKRNPEFDPPLR